MSIQINAATASEILKLIEKFLSKADQKWLNTRLENLIREPVLSVEEKHCKIDELCGSWAADQTISPIFSEIESQRMLSQPREVSF